MTQTIEQKTRLYDRDLNLWLEEAISLLYLIQKTMIKTQVLEAIKQMRNGDRLKVIEFALKLLRQDIDKPEKLSLSKTAEIMRLFYAEDRNLTEFVDANNEASRNFG